MSKIKEQSEITERNNSITERKIKNERGITLIALIITIIILLILAGITINLALAPDGIIKRAQTAGEEYRKEQDKEVAGINELTNLLDKIGAEEESKGTKWTYDHKTQTVTNGTDTFEIGDYVNYENPASGSYTALATSTGMDRAKEAGQADIGDQTFDVAKNPLRWRVLGVDEATGGLKLVGSPIKSNRVDDAKDPYFYLYGAKGYINGITELKKISEIFKNDLALEARSITMKDIDEITGVTEEQKQKMHESLAEYGERVILREQYTPESFLKNEKVQAEEYICNECSYNLFDTISEDILGMDGILPWWIALENSKAYNLICTNTNMDFGVSSGAPYWLGTRIFTGIGFDDRPFGNIYYGFGLSAVTSSDYEQGTIVGEKIISFRNYDDSGMETIFGLAVRPVVILKTDIPAGTIKKSENQSEEEPWEYTENLGV